MNWTIKRRIWALPLLSAVIFTIGVVASGMIAGGALTSIRTTGSVDYRVLDASKTLANEVEVLTAALRDAVAEGDKARVTGLNEQAAKTRAVLGKLAALDGQKANAARLRGEFDAWYAAALSSAKIMLELEQGDAEAVVRRMQSTMAVLSNDLAKMNKDAERQFNNGIAASESAVRDVITSIVITALLVLAFLALVSHFVIRTIWKQLGGEPEYARGIASAVAAGDLSMQIDTLDGDESSLLAALKEMQARLGTMVAGVKQSADTIRHASAEIASGNADLAARTESQAIDLESTSRAIEMLTATVQNNVGNADQANALVKQASSVATRGGEVVGGVVSTMGEINASAMKIVDIISVIDGIAFQTNILALNAAVEAARAGEQGRGFAVVASEVRNLAQRSAGAAKEIKALIGNSVEKVQAGAKLVDEAGVTMGQIVASVHQVAAIMEQMRASSQEQSAGILDIGRAMVNMDQMTQQNSALVEEASASAEALTDQTNQLSQALNVFKLAQLDVAARVQHPRRSVALNARQPLLAST